MFSSIHPKPFPSPSVRNTRSILLLALVASFGCAMLLPGKTAPSTAPNYEQALKARVQQYYSYMQLGKYGEASALVTKATRDRFVDAHKGSFISYALNTIKFDPPGSPMPKTAEVNVQLETFPFGAVASLHSPEITNWILEGKIWSLQAPEPHVATFEELTKGGKQPTAAAPEAVTFTTFKSDMGKLAIGEKGAAIFPFKNVSTHPVTLEVSTSCACLTVKSPKRQYQPGEAAELSLSFDSTDYLDDYAQTIFVKTLPGGAVTRLLVTGYVLRPGLERPEKPEKP